MTTEPGGRRWAARSLAGIAPACVLALAAVLLAAGFGRGLLLDDTWSLAAVRVPTWRAWAVGVAVQMLPYHLALSAWTVAGTSEAWAHALSAVFGLGAVAAAMWGVMSHSRLAAVLSGLVLACAPLMLRYGLEVRGYAMLACAVACLSALFARPVLLGRRAGRFAWQCALAVALALHPVAWMLLPAFAIADLVARPGRARRVAAWGRLVAWPVVLGGIVTVAGAWLHRRALATWWMPAPTPGLVVRIMAELAGVAAVQWPASLAARVATLCVVALGCASLVVHKRDSDPGADAAMMAGPRATPRSRSSSSRMGVALIGAAIVYGAGLLLLSLVFPVFWPRTLLPAIVPLTMGLALLVASSRTSVRLSATLAIIVACSAWSADWLQTGAHEAPEPWREAVTALARASRSGDRVIVHPDYAGTPLAYYAPQLSAGSLRVRFGDEGDALVRALEATRGPSAERQTLVLLRSDLSVRDRPRTVESLIATLAARRDEGDLHVFLLTAVDLSLVPDLAVSTDRLERLAIAAFGPPREITRARQLTHLVFVTGRTPARNP